MNIKLAFKDLFTFRPDLKNSKNPYQRQASPQLLFIDILMTEYASSSYSRVKKWVLYDF